MTAIDISLEQLRQMIGQRVRHQMVECVVIEVLEDGPSLVLQACTEDGVIQANRFGEAHRRVPQSYTVPVLTRDRQAFHPAYLELDLL